MGQVYLQRFDYMGPVEKSDFEQTWGEALRTFASTGNWGGTEKGVKHIRTYGTAWGGYILIEVEDPEAFGRYQAHTNQTYGRIARNTFEPLFDMDATFKPVVQGMGAKKST